MQWRNIAELLKLCNTPISIISPFPFFALSLFLISHKEFYVYDLSILIAGIVVTLSSNFASNLWNHCNDLKEDKAAGKETILIQTSSMQKPTIFIAVLLYTFSVLFVYYLSMKFERPIYQYFLIWAIITWWYSDNIILKKLIGFRLKEHYIGELITYGVAWPAYTLSIWLIYSDLNATAAMMAAAFFFLGISGLLLKDLKDISGDRQAGLKTLGVAFSSSRLIRCSCFLMVLYYLVLLSPISINLLGINILIVIFPFVYFLKNTFIHMYKKNWALDMGDLKALKSIGVSIYASITFIGLGTLI